MFKVRMEKFLIKVQDKVAYVLYEHEKISFTFLF